MCEIGIVWSTEEIFTEIYIQIFGHCILCNNSQRFGSVRLYFIRIRSEHPDQFFFCLHPRIDLITAKNRIWTKVQNYTHLRLKLIKKCPKWSKSLFMFLLYRNDKINQNMAKLTSKLMFHFLLFCRNPKIYKNTQTK